MVTPVGVIKVLDFGLAKPANEFVRQFVGGADILREMFEADELRPFLAERGIALEPVS